MYVKIETERLTFIRLNQAKQRSEEYIHLRDAISTEWDAANVGRLTILPATYTGSPRHMHEICARCNDICSSLRSARSIHYLYVIVRMLLPGQTSSDRHDITARVFKQKIRSLMNYIVKQHVFGDTLCCMYSIEWQKRGLPHAHIFIWLVEWIRPDQIDDIICAEIPDPETDPDLHDVVITNMVTSMKLSSWSICELQWGDLADILISYSRTLSNCCTFGGASGEWPTSIFHRVKCRSTSL